MAFICSQCGQKIIGGSAHKLNGKNLCASCYNKQVQADIAQQQMLNALYKYIRELFCLSECPIEIVNAIDRLLKEGRKLNGIRATVYYYYQILGNQFTMDHRYYFYKIINDEYEHARDYMAEREKISQKNKEVTFDTPPITVKISPKDLNKKRKNFINFKMEDL